MHLERSLPVGRPFSQFFIFGTNWYYNLPNNLSYFKNFSLESLVVSLSHFIFLNQHIVESLYSSIIYRLKFHHHDLTVLLRSKAILPENS